MADQVKFVKISEEKYQSLETKDPNTFYNTGSKMYVGNITLSGNASVDTSSNNINIICGNPPKACTNFTCEFDDDHDVLKFQWEDTDDAYWGGVRLVVKQGSAPEHEDDGFFIKDVYILNSYKTTPLEVSIVDSDTYYAILFPFDTNKVMNRLKVNSINLIVNNTVNFAQSSWAKIAAISEAGDASKVFTTGNTKELTTTDGNTYTMKIISMDCCEKVDGTTNGILVMAQSTTDIRYSSLTVHDCNYTIDTNKNHYEYNNKIVDPQDIVDDVELLFDIMPEDLKPYIKEVKQSLFWDNKSSNPNNVVSLLYHFESTQCKMMLPHIDINGYNKYISNTYWPKLNRKYLLVYPNSNWSTSENSSGIYYQDFKYRDTYFASPDTTKYLTDLYKLILFYI